MSLPRLRSVLCWVSAVCAACTHAAPFDDRVAALFRAPLAEQMALSPDGRRVAYTTQVGKDLVVMIINVEFPGPKTSVIVDEERTVPFSEENERAQLRFLKWATSDRLVFSPTVHVVTMPSAGESGALTNGPFIYAPIMAVDGDGRNAKVLIDAREFTFTPPEPERGEVSETAAPIPQRWIGRHLDIVGLAPGNREQLLIEARGLGRLVATERYALDVRTGKYTDVSAGPPTRPRPDEIIDEYRGTVVGVRTDKNSSAITWSEGPLRDAQRELARKFPRRRVEILEWSENYARVLVRVTGGGDPGRVYVYQRPENLVLEIFRRAPWLNSGQLHDTRFFEFDAEDGAHLSGYVTWPNRPRFQPPPMIVCFPSGFPGHAQPEFDPEAQVLADLGFIVLRLNHRYVAGVPRNRRATLAAEVDRLAVHDARVAIEWVAERNPSHRFDRRRIAALGRGFGGYLAMRALQQEPSIFRCGVAIDAPTDLRPWLWPAKPDTPAAELPPDPALPRAWFDEDRTDWKKLAVTTNVEALTSPLYLLVEPTRNQAVDIATAGLRSKLKSLGRAPDYLALDPGFFLARPKARASTYRKIEEFFNLRLYDYDVKIGPAKEVK